MSMTRRTLFGSASGAGLLALATACARPEIKGASALATLDAVETAAKIRAGEISGEEAVEAAIARAERIEPKLNAIAFKTYAAARKNVATAAGPWAGVPTFVKDLDDITDQPSGYGSRAFPGRKGGEQTPLINAFLGLGVVSLGKSTTPEFGLTATTEPASTGKTRNPWNTDYSTGGSSGGAAALVASGVVPIAHASDGGGSIRIPASCCGVVGLKMSRGRHPMARPESTGPISLSVHGVETRTVRDTAAVVAAFESAAGDTGLPPVGLVTSPAARRLRIGLFTKGPSNRPVDAEVVESTRKTAALCESLGHAVEDVALPFQSGIEEAFLLYWAASADTAVSFWEKATGLKRNGLAFEPFTLGLSAHYQANKDKMEGAIARLQAVSAEYESMFAGVDVLLSPVLAAPPVAIGYLDVNLDFEVVRERLLDYVQFTGLHNIVGAPSISLPLSMSTKSLPIGALFGARVGDEKTLLDLSYELERAAPWIDRRPPIFG